MGWQTDWLYQLVFQEVADIWQRTRNCTEHLGAPPTSLHIYEFAKADWDGPRCRGKATRGWQYDEIEGLQPAEVEEVRQPTLQGAMYDIGVVRFHIATSRKQVLFEYVLGPRYGRGQILDVEGQGERGQLKRSMNRQWVS